MKSIIIVLTLLSVVLALPLDDSKNAQVLRYDNDNNGIDGYKFGFETSDGVVREEQGELKNAGTDQEALSVRGAVEWIGDDGKKYYLRYLADENGFQPFADHIPQPLSIQPELLQD